MMSKQNDMQVTPAGRVQAFLDVVNARATTGTPFVYPAGTDILAHVGGTQLRLSDLAALITVAASGEQVAGVLPPDSDASATEDEVEALRAAGLGPDIDDQRGRHWFNDYSEGDLVQALRAGYALRGQSGE